MRTLLRLSILLLGAMCAAQSVTTSLSTSTMTAGATGPGGILDFATQPAGPVALPGAFAHTAFGGQARIDWATLGTPTTGGTTTFQHTLIAGATPAVLAATGTFTLEYASTAPVAAALFVIASFSGSSGAPIPVIDVDFQADGTFELQSVLGPVVDFGTHVISPAQPLRIAIRMQTTLPANLWNLVGSLEVTLTPVNDLDAVQTAVACAPTPAFLRCTPTFVDTGIDITYEPPTSPLIVVVGLGAQPTVLPPVGFIPCLLVPRPDLLLFAPPPTSSHHIALPPAVRPVTFFVQGVVLDPTGLQTTEGFAVAAF